MYCTQIFIGLGAGLKTKHNTTERWFHFASQTPFEVSFDIMQNIPVGGGVGFFIVGWVVMAR